MLEAVERLFGVFVVESEVRVLEPERVVLRPQRIPLRQHGVVVGAGDKVVVAGEEDVTKNKQTVGTDVAILRQLRKMGINMQRLYAQSKLQFICTEEDDVIENVNDFKQRLEKNSAKNNPQYDVL